MNKKLKIKDLTPDDKNFNKGSEFGNSLIEKSFRKFGAGRSILIDKNNRIIAGNKSIENAAALGMDDIEVIESDGTKIIAVKRTDIDLDSEIGREMALADNASAKANIVFDAELIEAEVGEAVAVEWGIELEKEIPIAEEDDFYVPNEIQTDIVLGDLFEIGEHRLLCGDSTDTNNLDLLLQNKKPELLLTDPPYGIDYGNQLVKGDEFSEKTNKHGWRNFGNPKWDKSKPENGVLQYLCQITENQIIWGGNYFTDDLPPTMGWLIWDKGQRGFSLADGEMAWTSFNNALRIKEYARAKANREEKNHPTQKPQDIMNWCFEYADRHSKIEIKLVLDAYLGSGSTMVASHQLKRKCYGMELDPKYCQVIIDRMIKLDSTLEIKKNGVKYESKQKSS